MSQAPDTKTQRLERLKLIERLILIPILLMAVGAFFAFGRVAVVGISMEPTLHDGQRLMIFKLWRQFSPLKVGDVIVIAPRPGKEGRDQEVVKRIVFLQNERGDAPVPSVVNSPIGVYKTSEVFRENNVDLNVPKGIYVLGDNINKSADSRDYGAVLEADVLGKVMK